MGRKPRRRRTSVEKIEKAAADFVKERVSEMTKGYPGGKEIAKVFGDATEVFMRSLRESFERYFAGREEKAE